MLRWRNGLMGLILTGFASMPLAASGEPPATSPARGAQAPSLVDVEVNGQTLDDLVNILHSADPAFNAVVVRDAGGTPTAPLLGFKLSKVTIPQVMDLLRTAYSDWVEVREIDGSNGSFYCIKVHRDPVGPAAQAVGAVKVYPLTELVASLAATTPPAKNGGETRTHALDSILSLIKAAVGHASGSDRAPVLEIHEETQTLIFQGTSAEEDAVENVISALRSRSEPAEISQLKERAASGERAAELDKLESKEQIQGLRQELVELRGRLSEREAAYLQQAVENERLKMRLENLGRSSKKADSPG